MFSPGGLACAQALFDLVYHLLEAGADRRTIPPLVDNLQRLFKK